MIISILTLALIREARERMAARQRALENGAALVIARAVRRCAARNVRKAEVNRRLEVAAIVRIQVLWTDISETV